MTKPARAVVSVDFDFFVREELIWDWGHNESSLFFEAIWPLRYASASFDVVQETDPRIYADFQPEQLLLELMAKDFRFHDNTQIAVADSHSAIASFLDSLGLSYPELFVNIDAYHDLYNENESLDCGNWWTRFYDKWSKARHVHVYPSWQDSSLVDTPVRKVEQIAWKEFQPIGPIAVDAMFICRSGCWVPPHLDKLFNRMIKRFHPTLFIPPRHINKKDVRMLKKQLVDIQRSLKERQQ